MLLAKAMLGEPKLLILDNPYIGLDSLARKAFNDLIDHLAFHERKTIIMAGHYQNLPACISHRIHLEAGEVKAMGSLESVEKDLGEYRKSGPVETELEAIKSYYQVNSSPATVESVVRMEEVEISYGGRPILDKINWNIRPGEKWALLGGNGSGKSTLLSLMYGDHPQAYSNQVFLFDRRRGSGESIWDIKKRVGFTSPELHAYFDHGFTALELVLSGLWDGFVRRRATEAQETYARQLFAYYQLAEIGDQPFRHLSTGTQRLLFFLRALIKCPELLLLDEPFQGFDEIHIQRSRRLLDGVLTDWHTLLFITHFEAEIPDSVDQVFRL
jgi:molybdate transport system ATP-binding protein